MDVPNTSQIDNIAEGNMEFKSKMIHVLRKEIIIEKSTYLDAIEDLKLSKAAEMVHKTKNKIGILSMVNSYNFAISYEENLRQGNADDHIQFVKILETIENFINKLKP